MDGIGSVQARIQQILGQFGTRPAGGVLGKPPSASGDVSASGSTDFATALALAESQPTGATMPVSTGELSPSGVDPVRWAKDFLTKLGMPITSENMRLMVAWQKAEGTKARFNPLATTQGGFAGSTQFNSVGVKNFATYQDGIDANVKVITNGLYENVLAALRRGTSAEEVAQAIAASPWGTGHLVSKVLAQG
jgi:hypothetical protein